MIEGTLSRLGRYRRAMGFFHRLLPGLGEWRIQKLINLAVSYWEQPKRFM